MAKIIVQDAEITVVSIEERDYISLTDMVKPIENGLALIEKWLRNKNSFYFFKKSIDIFSCMPPLIS